jgi:hypothetical protein
MTSYLVDIQSFIFIRSDKKTHEACGHMSYKPKSRSLSMTRIVIIIHPSIHPCSVLLAKSAKKPRHQSGSCPPGALVAAFPLFALQPIQESGQTFSTQQSRLNNYVETQERVYSPPPLGRKLDNKKKKPPKVTSAGTRRRPNPNPNNITRPIEKDNMYESILSLEPQFTQPLALGCS